MLKGEYELPVEKDETQEYRDPNGDVTRARKVGGRDGTEYRRKWKDRGLTDNPLFAMMRPARLGVSRQFDALSCLGSSRLRPRGARASAGQAVGYPAPEPHFVRFDAGLRSEGLTRLPGRARIAQR